MLRRIRELATETADHVNGQHVVTRVLLRRFAAASGPDKGLLYPFALRYPQARHRLLGPDGCGKVPDFITFASGSAERLWKETEDKLHDALAAVDNGTLLGSPEHIATIKEAIALHYVRSSAAPLVHVRTWVRVCAASRVRWLTNWRWLLEVEFYRAKGFCAAGDQALGLFLDQMMQPSIDRAVSGQLFRVRIEDLFSQARQWMRGQGLEILTPASGEFLIGDVPALTIRHGLSQAGVLGGIALGDAHTVIMPLGPRHLAALGRTDLTGELSSDQVASINARQVASAIEYAYLRPGSGLEQTVRSLAERRQVAA
jgi:hypothetical protein